MSDQFSGSAEDIVASGVPGPSHVTSGDDGSPVKQMRMSHRSSHHHGNQANRATRGLKRPHYQRGKQQQSSAITSSLSPQATPTTLEATPTERPESKPLLESHSIPHPSQATPTSSSHTHRGYMMADILSPNRAHPNSNRSPPSKSTLLPLFQRSSTTQHSAAPHAPEPTRLLTQDSTNSQTRKNATTTQMTFNPPSSSLTFDPSSLNSEPSSSSSSSSSYHPFPRPSNPAFNASTNRPLAAISSSMMNLDSNHIGGASAWLESFCPPPCISPLSSSPFGQASSEVPSSLAGLGGDMYGFSDAGNLGYFWSQNPCLGSPSGAVLSSASAFPGAGSSGDSLLNEVSGVDNRSNQSGFKRDPFSVYEPSSVSTQEGGALLANRSGITGSSLPADLSAQVARTLALASSESGRNGGRELSLQSGSSLQDTSYSLSRSTPQAYSGNCMVPSFDNSTTLTWSHDLSSMNPPSILFPPPPRHHTQSDNHEIPSSSSSDNLIPTSPHPPPTSTSLSQQSSSHSDSTSSIASREPRLLESNRQSSTSGIDCISRLSSAFADDVMERGPRADRGKERAVGGGGRVGQTVPVLPFHSMGAAPSTNSNTQASNSSNSSNSSLNSLHSLRFPPPTAATWGLPSRNSSSALSSDLSIAGASGRGQRSTTQRGQSSTRRVSKEEEEESVPRVQRSRRQCAQMLEGGEAGQSSLLGVTTSHDRDGLFGSNHETSQTSLASCSQRGAQSASLQSSFVLPAGETSLTSSGIFQETSQSGFPRGLGTSASEPIVISDWSAGARLNLGSQRSRGRGSSPAHSSSRTDSEVEVIVVDSGSSDESDSDDDVIVGDVIPGVDLTSDPQTPPIPFGGNFTFGHAHHHHAMPHPPGGDSDDEDAFGILSTGGELVFSSGHSISLQPMLDVTIDFPTSPTDNSHALATHWTSGDAQRFMARQRMATARRRARGNPPRARANPQGEPPRTRGESSRSRGNSGGENPRARGNSHRSRAPWRSMIFQQLLYMRPRYEELLELAERLGPARPQGLSQTVLTSLPEWEFRKEGEGPKESCVVCMSEYVAKEMVRGLPCQHNFHSGCIDRWLKDHRTCPICRVEVKVQ